MHTFLAIPIDIIPPSVAGNVPTFNRARKSNDGNVMLIDGFRNGHLVHSKETLGVWLQGEEEKTRPFTIQSIISRSTEYTYDQIKAMESDPASIWYVEPDE